MDKSDKRSGQPFIGSLAKGGCGVSADTPLPISLITLMILGDFGGCIPCGRRAQKFVTTERGYVYHREGLHSPPRGVTLLKSNSLLSLEPLAFIRLLFFGKKIALHDRLIM